MSKYRINVRFDLDKPMEANAAQYLQSLDKSRNAFMVTAVLNEMQRQSSASGGLLEDIRQVIREELQEVSFAAAPPVFEQVQPCWMTLKCSAEPKRRHVAQITVFAAESEPLWRNTPRGKKATFSIVQRRNSLKSRYPSAAFLYALRGASHGITSRDFVCHKSPNHSRNRLTLWGRSPQSPEGRSVMLWGKIFVLQSG